MAWPIIIIILTSEQSPRFSLFTTAVPAQSTDVEGKKDSNAAETSCMMNNQSSLLTLDDMPPLNLAVTVETYHAVQIKNKNSKLFHLCLSHPSRDVIA